MPNYKLTYFKIRGRAETARYIFAYSGINYQDNTIDIMDWPNIKKSLLFQQIPILNVDETEINQSTAIARYLARETGIAGKSNLEQAQVDAIVDTINDFMNMFPWTEKDPVVKQKITEDVFANKIPLFLDGLSKLLGDRMWFIGDSVTWADFHWAVCSITLTNLNVDILHNYPKLSALKERVEALPKIAAWIERRPKTPL
ncbi:hematopoietic prostaglandin D synthase-like [Stegostoma tigrinum]|uniref:hematopoietic prostaglandin D synthase-like n=1 Tax=Stegostoma tigrinum TaxID=3053191 RepID=UPI00287045A0|nr:hematopoietic prostaglandin D synthase-like [Stegostoma tigrinum]XP_048392553.2 hematopoietic prostaglandin D synthase-like [Stegostoma tigrinum]